MKNLATLFALLVTLSFNSSIFAHHEHNNPPCNHESLQEAREGLKQDH